MKLSTPLLTKTPSMHLLEVESVKTNEKGMFIRSRDGLQFEVVILFVMIVKPGTDRLDSDWLVPDCTNGIYKADNGTWYQLAWQKASKVFLS